jgi:uncharacterized protein YoxC
MNEFVKKANDLAEDVHALAESLNRLAAWVMVLCERLEPRSEESKTAVLDAMALVTRMINQIARKADDLAVELDDFRGGPGSES